MAEPLALPGPGTRLQDLPYVRQLVSLGGLALAIAVGIWLFTWTQKPAYVAVYPGLEAKDAAEVLDALRAAQVAVQLDPATGAVTVPEADLQSARLKLAAAGLPAGSRMGIEMIQRDQGFGASQFVEGARYQHALETELARTIAAVRPVRSARVHLALPRASAFASRREPASASVLVDLLPGRSLEREQVAAIVHMVASSIPELSAERVTVIDQSGRLLTRDPADSDAELAAEQFAQTRRIESTYVERIQRLLEPLTGPGRVSAQVAVDMDFAVTEEARESFAPDGRLRSEQVSEAVTEARAAAGIPGATSNQPPEAAPPTTADGQAAVDQAAAPPSNSSRSSTRNFEMDRTVSHTRQPAGRVRRVSVAVLVDHVPAAPLAAPAAGDAEEDGGAEQESAEAPAAPALRALTAEEIAQVEKLVREAVGFDAERGDTLSVMNAPFARIEPPAPLEEPPLWQQPHLREYARLALGTLVVLVLVFGVLRPLLRGLATPRISETVLTTTIDGGSVPALGHDNAQTAELIAPPIDQHEARLQRARQSVQQDPRKVAQVMKAWVGGDA
ncbi:MAG: flagellar basal-body MS-ring/collar protein FliF [Pseudomonadota bacterium]